MSDPVPEKPKKTQRRATGEDKKFMLKHMDTPDWTDERLAQQLDLSVETVKNFRKEMGGTNQKYVNVKTLEEIKEKLRVVSGEEEKKYLYRQEFVLSERSKRLHKMFTTDDYQLVVEKWAGYKYQLPEMTIAEEDTLEKMLVLDVRMIQNQKSMRACQEQQELIRKQLLNLLSDSEDGEIDQASESGKMISQTLQSLNSSENELNKNYQILLKEYGNLQESLNATRQQREKNQKVGAETFFDLVKKLSDSEAREKIGRETALQKKAMQKKMSQLKKPHQYLDGSYDLPILNSDSVQTDEEEDLEELEKKPEEKTDEPTEN